ncbi:MAG: hypothetical protein HRT88_01155 [Lentisphaeraceae bacterium]|nr:hypothetical protein [Lentisphaeraceae bacterium]
MDIPQAEPSHQKADLHLKKELMAGKCIYHQDIEIFRSTIALTVKEIHETEFKIAITKTAIVESILMHPNPRISHMKGIDIKVMADCSSALISKIAKDRGLTIWTKELEVINFIEKYHHGKLEDAEPIHIAKSLEIHPVTVKKAITKMQTGGHKKTIYKEPTPKKYTVTELKETIKTLEKEKSFFETAFNKLKLDVEKLHTGLSNGN